MELFVDTGNLALVKEVAAKYPIDGFTTNPKILAAVKEPMDEMFPAYKQYVEETGLKIFIQVTATDAEGMLGQAQCLKGYFGDKLVVKIPATVEGFRAVPLCKQAGVAVCVTVIHSVMQAIMAAKAGADYVAPYVNRFDNMGWSGCDAIVEMIDAFANCGYDCKVLGASFRTVSQIKDLIVNGCPAVTIKAEMFDDLVAHPATNESMAGFEAAWKNGFGDAQVTDFVPKA